MYELVIAREGEEVQRLRLGAGAFVIGRQEGCDVVLDDKEVSRQHARLLIDGPVVVLQDLGSGNGTFLDGAAVEQAVLPLDETFEIVPFTFSVRLVGEIPAPEPEAWLEIVDGPGTGQRFRLGSAEAGIGRHEDQQVRLPDQSASRAHATVSREGDGWVLRDKGSVNGTLVNDAKVDRHPLVDGDTFLIGNTTLRFDGPTAPPTAPVTRPAAPASEAGTTPGWLVPVIVGFGLFTVVAAAAAWLLVS